MERSKRDSENASKRECSEVDRDPGLKATVSKDTTHTSHIGNRWPAIANRVTQYWKGVAMTLASSSLCSWMERRGMLTAYI